MKTQFLLLNSFDRSGSTLISKALANHPRVENLFNPFNATVFRREFMRIWDYNKMSDSKMEGENLIRLILKGNFSKEHIKSRVFFPHSSTLKLKEGSLHIIKVTNFHTKIKWFKLRFPEIPIRGLVRSPISILASLVRNGFHQEWYGGWAFPELKANINQYNLSNDALEIIHDCEDEIEQMACVIACMNREMLLNLAPNEIIRYEQVVFNPNLELGRLLQQFELKDFDFEPYFSNSVNSSGKNYTGKEVYSELFSKEMIQKYSYIIDVIGNYTVKPILKHD